jgi:Zn-dependent protease with chaperone function
VERRLGAAVDNQLRTLLGHRICEDRSGEAALRSLTLRLAAAAGLPVAPDVAVLASRIPNAVALPGGRIYLFEGLLDRAESLDEIAGVLAHEMGHVAHRDGLRKLIQAGGSSFLLGLFFGDVTGSGTLILAGRLVLEGAYSRDAERAADRSAAATMSSLGRSPRPMGLLLQRIDKGGEMPALLASHPLTQDRLRFLESHEPGRSGDPLLSEQEWRDLKSICKSG